MIDEHGAKGSDEDFGIAFDYLVRNYGKVNVNRAATREITAVLGLSAKEAEAILNYRRENGDFQDFDGLLKVPGIDVEKLKQGKDAVTF
jgi:competence protein ComEA